MTTNRALQTGQRFLAVTLLVLFAVGAPCAEPELAKTVKFNIAPQRLTDALVKYTEQSGIQITSPAELLEGKTCAGVVGALSARSALEQLLKGSNLAYSVIGNSTITLRSSAPPATNKPPVVGDAGTAEFSTLQLAQAGTVAAAGAKASRKDEVEEMLVEGERDKPAPFSTGNLDLTRTEDDVLPFTVFTAEEVRTSGAIDLQDFFQKRLSQNFNPYIVKELDGSGTSASNRVNSIDFRGVGARETVFLLNGRRMPPQYQSGVGDAENATPNLQLIPLGMIERIEILSSAGSAIYGSGATGGVINIILRRDVRGGELSVNYDSPADVHRPTRGMDFSYGLPLKWGLGMRLLASYSEREPLHARDRSAITIVRYRDRVLQFDPGRMLNRFIRPPIGSTPNIRTLNLILDSAGNVIDFDANANLFGPGTANFTTSPDGYDGNGSPADFTPGVYNLGLAGGAVGDSLAGVDSRLGVSSSNTVLSAGLDKQFGNRWRWSLDANYATGKSEGRIDASLSFTEFPTQRYPFIPASAPVNPFDRDVVVTLVDPRLQTRQLGNRPETYNYGLSTTLSGVFGEWRGFWDASYSAADSRGTNEVFYEPGGGWRNAFMTGAYDPFVDARTVAPAQPGFYDDYIAIRSRVRSVTRGYQSAIKFSGPVLRLPAGTVQLTAGTDWQRTDRARNTLFSQFQDGLTGEPRTPVGAPNDVLADEEPSYYLFNLNTYGVYAEANIPLLSSVQHIPLVRELEVFGSSRFVYQTLDGFRQDDGEALDQYSNDSHFYAFGFRHAITAGVSVRVSRSLGFLPTAIAAITPSIGPLPGESVILSDPVRGEDVPLDYTRYLYGPNPEIKPETSDATNMGLIFAPAYLPGLRISLDYVKSIRNDTPLPLDPSLAVYLESVFPGRVRRGPADGHPSGVGPIIFVDGRDANYGEILYRSVDFTARQEVENVFGGQLSFMLAVTRNLNLRYAFGPGDKYEQVRSRDPFYGSGQQLAWNGNAQLGWQRRGWHLGWSARYFDYVLVSESDIAFQGTDRADVAVEHDVFLGYDATAASSRGLLSGMSLTLGVTNVFDREPRFWGADFERGVAPYDSIAGRSIWMRVARKF